MGDVLTKLKGNVDKLEARNEARRGVTSLSQRPSSSSIARSFNRLESLKAIHHDAQPDAGTVLPTEVDPAKTDTPSATPTTSIRPQPHSSPRRARPLLGDADSASEQEEEVIGWALHI